MRKKRFLIAIGGFILLGFLVGRFATPIKSDTIPYHLDRLGELRQSTAWKHEPNLDGDVSDYLRPKLWLWHLRGKPTMSKTLQQSEQHQQALIRLGHFERRELMFTNRTLWDPQLWNEFRLSVSNSPLADWRYMLHLDEKRPSVIRVTACKSDIPTFEQIARRLDGIISR